MSAVAVDFSPVLRPVSFVLVLDISDEEDDEEEEELEEGRHKCSSLLLPVYAATLSFPAAAAAAANFTWDGRGHDLNRSPSLFRFQLRCCYCFYSNFTPWMTSLVDQGFYRQPDAYQKLSLSL